MFDRNKDKDKHGSKPEMSADELNSDMHPTAKPRTATQSTFRNQAMIGSTVKIKGELSGDEDLVIEGSVEGHIYLPGHELTVGEAGNVNADIKGKTIKVNGQVNGDITGAENVILSKSGRMEGNIITPRMTLEDGAVFKGSIDMDPEATHSKSSKVVSGPKSVASVSSSDAPGKNLKSG